MAHHALPTYPPLISAATGRAILSRLALLLWQTQWVLPTPVGLATHIADLMGRHMAPRKLTSWLAIWCTSPGPILPIISTTLPATISRGLSAYPMADVLHLAVRLARHIAHHLATPYTGQYAHHVGSLHVATYNSPYGLAQSSALKHAIRDREMVDHVYLAVGLHMVPHMGRGTVRGRCCRRAAAGDSCGRLRSGTPSEARPTYPVSAQLALWGRQTT